MSLFFLLRSFFCIDVKGRGHADWDQHGQHSKPYMMQLQYTRAGPSNGVREAYLKTKMLKASSLHIFIYSFFPRAVG